MRHQMRDVATDVQPGKRPHFMDGGKDALLVGQSELAVHARRHLRGDGVAQPDDVGAGLYLRPGESDFHLGAQLQQVGYPARPVVKVHQQRALTAQVCSLR